MQRFSFIYVTYDIANFEINPFLLESKTNSN